jgi:crotonobetainyl-CoA:carnitine CoA-transferase CaiB-like acyl-CoA transferase
MISMPGYGATGPYRDYPAFGTSLEQHAGFSSILGYLDSGPYRTQAAYTDPLVGVSGVGAVMLALLHRRRTGEGQHIELAHFEASICLLGPEVLDYAMNRRHPQRPGNRHSSMAPHGCYRCRDGDSWISISVADDKQWRAFCGAIGNLPWTKEKRFADQLSRWHNQDELDKLITEWTVRQDHRQAMQKLQEAGVPAGAVLNAKELVEDPHLKDRGYFIEVTHPQAGTHRYPGFPLKLSRADLSLDRPSPCVGQHNDHVLGGLLGLSKEEIARLKEERVVSDGPILL